MLFKRLRINVHMFCLFALVVAATVIRFILIYHNWPTTNSDEGNMGLLAMHVAFNGEHPIFFYGLPYLGPFQGYVAALLFRLFGVSLYTLRLALLLMFPLFLVSMYFLTRLLYTRGLALFTTLLLALGSKDLISLQLKAVGEYAELELFAVLMSLLSAWLALTSQPYADDFSYSRGVKWIRVAMYAGLGLVVGLALWVDFLIGPFVIMALLLLLLFCRHELRSWAGLALLLGIIVGAMPLLIYNVSAPLSQNSLAILVGIHHGGADEMAVLHLPWIREFFGAALIGLPMLTGLNPRCSLTSFPTFGPFSSSTLPCTAFYGSWALGYILLGCISACVAGYVAWKLWRRARLEVRPLTLEQRHEVILQCARLMLLSSAGLTLLAYILSPTAAVYTEATARYMMCIVVAVPSILWPLWNGLGALIRRGGLRSRGQLLLRMGLLLYVLYMFFIGTIRTFADVPVGQANYNQIGHLVQNLLHIGATRIYSDYWTCNNLTFRSQEQIICAALDDQLQPGFDRYVAYRDTVRAAPHPVYVLVVGSAQASSFERTSANILATYRRYNFDGYVVYQPIT